MLRFTPTRPRPVFCVAGHAYRDVTVASRVCSGQYSHLGTTLDLGLPPDWMSRSLPGDKEWRIEWSKFYYGLDLAHAFATTGDTRFLQTWQTLVTSWIDQVPADFDRSDVIGRRIQNWIYAWNRFADHGALAGTGDLRFASKVLASLRDQVRHLRSNLTAERNHRTFELYALLIAALAVPDLDMDGGLAVFAMDELHRNLLADIRPDGVHREASTHYHLVALRTFLGARENARRFDLRFPTSYDERLQAACDFAMHCHRPDGGVPAFSDADTGRYQDLLLLAADIFDRADYRYAGSFGASGTPPRATSPSFTDGGYHMQRSGWGSSTHAFSDERFLMFDCGPLGDGGHGHYDLLSVEVSAHGEPLIMDPGRYTYSDAPPDWRRWFKGTAAHNTVRVDGVDQTPYHRGKPKGPIAEGRLVTRQTAPGFDAIVGEARSPVYDAVHRRRVLFVGGEYWIIEDDLRGEGSHTYDLRFHLAPSAMDRTSIEASTAAMIVHAPGLTLAFSPRREVTIEPGWIAPVYGTRWPAPVINVRAVAPSARFVTLVLPRSVDTAPRMAVVEDRGIRSLTLDAAGPRRDGCDRVIWSDEPRRIELGPFAGEATAVWLRESRCGDPLLVRALTPAGSVGWSAGGGPVLENVEAR